MARAERGLAKEAPEALEGTVEAPHCVGRERLACDTTRNGRVPTVAEIAGVPARGVGRIDVRVVHEALQREGGGT